MVFGISRNSVKADLALNLFRQVASAALFFLFASIVTRKLTPNHVAQYFLAWSASQLLAALVSFGISAAIARDLLTNTQLTPLACVRQHQRSLLLQFLSSWCAAYIYSLTVGGTVLALGLFSFGLALNAVLSAISVTRLGLRVHALMEVGHPAFQIAMLLLMPIYGHEQLSWFFVVATLFRAIVTLTWPQRRIEEWQHTNEKNNETKDSQLDSKRFAVLSYSHGLLSAGTTRLLPVIVSKMIGVEFEQLAQYWLLFDRLTSLVTGVNQILYVRLVRGLLSYGQTIKVWCGVLFAFILSSLAIIAYKTVFGQQTMLPELAVLLISLIAALATQCLWHLILNYLVAIERFDVIFVGHGVYAVGLFAIMYFSALFSSYGVILVPIILLLICLNSMRAIRRTVV